MDEGELMEAHLKLQKFEEIDGMDVTSTSNLISISETRSEEPNQSDYCAAAVCAPTEILRIIFGHLDRWTLDRCELVCRSWRAVVRRFSAEYQRRHIDYIVFSSLGSFSITARSRSRVCRLECPSRFDASELSNPGTIGITKQLYRAPVEDLYMWPSQLVRFRPYHLQPHPHRAEDVKRLADSQIYYLETPPLRFFQSLNSLLVGHHPVVGHIGFYECMINEMFVNRLLAGVEPILWTREQPWFVSQRSHVSHSVDAQAYYKQLVIRQYFDPFDAARKQCWRIRQLEDDENAEQTLKKYIRSEKPRRKTLIQR